MKFIMIDPALFDSLLDKLNKLVGEANKIHNNGKDTILEQWLEAKRFVKFWVSPNGHYKHYVKQVNPLYNGEAQNLLPPSRCANCPQ